MNRRNFLKLSALTAASIVVGTEVIKSKSIGRGQTSAFVNIDEMAYLNGDFDGESLMMRARANSKSNMARLLQEHVRKRVEYKKKARALYKAGDKKMAMHYDRLQYELKWKINGMPASHTPNMYMSQKYKV